MYCPVDGTEWREGITRCPEHDVDLVDEPPELEDDDHRSRLGLFGLERAVRAGVFVVAGAGVAWAIGAIYVNAWLALSTSAEWSRSGAFKFFQFLRGAAAPITLATVAFLIAAILGRGFARLGAPPSGVDEQDNEPDPAPALTGRTAWIVTVLTSLVAVFVLLWVVTGVALAWDTAQYQGGFAGMPPSGPDDGWLTLSALNDAAYHCGFGALATLAALLMARAYDRLSGPR